MQDAIILAAILLLLAISAAAERAEKKSRRYYTDQALLRLSGFCIGAAIALAVAALALSP